MAKLLTTVNASLRALELKPQDEAAAELARHYARQLDAGGDPVKLGPPLLAVLEALLITPRARAAGTKGVPTDAPAAEPVNPLDELRARRDRRRAG